MRVSVLETSQAGDRAGHRSALETTTLARILLVEDNEMNRDMLSRRLTRKGHEVILAVDGIEGVSKAQQDAPDLVLMDLSLPRIDGWEATRRIKAEPGAPPIIALTAHAMQGDRERALDAGADDYDTKPVDLKRLLGKIEALLRASAQAAAARSSDAASGGPA